MTGGSKLLFSLIRKNWSTQLLLFVMAGLSLALAFPAPFLIRFLLDEGLTFLSRDKIHLAFVAILLCAFLTSGLSYLENKLFVDYSQRFYQEFKEMLLAHWLTISPMNFHKYHSGYVANRFIHEIQGVISFFIRLFNKFIIDILSLSVSLLILFWLSWKLALISLVGLPLLWFLLQYMQIRIQNANELAYEQQALLGKNLQDLLQGIWAILSIQAQSWALTKYHSTNDSVRLHQTRLSLLESTFTLLASLVVTVIPLGILWIGCIQIQEHTLTLGTLIAFYSLLLTSYGPLLRLSSTQLNWQEVRVAWKRTLEFLTLPIHTPQTSNSLSGLHVHEASFSYPNSQKPLFEKINLSLSAQGLMLLKGSNGCGKSTLLKCIAGFYPLLSGHIQCAQPLTWMPQEICIFEATLSENLLMGRDMKEKELIDFCKRHSLWTWINELPEKLNTLVGENGKSLSGGQRRKVGFLRALLGSPRVLLLDEPTNDLDLKSRLLQKEILRKLRTTTTIVIVSHDELLKDIATTTLDLSLDSESVSLQETVNPKRTEERR